MRSRAEHLAWCKQRALEYADLGDVATAHASLASDMSKHPGTVWHPGPMRMIELIVAGRMKTGAGARAFIETLD